MGSCADVPTSTSVGFGAEPIPKEESENALDPNDVVVIGKRPARGASIGLLPRAMADIFGR